MSTDPSNAALDLSSASASAPQVDATAAQVPTDADLEERRTAALADWEEQVRFLRGSAKTSDRLLRLSHAIAAFGQELADIRMDDVTEFKEAKKSEIVAWLAAQDELTRRLDRYDHQPG